MRIIDENLSIVSDKIFQLWELVEKAYLDIREAYIKNDRKLALKVSKKDKIINELEETINDYIVQTITLYSPVASDLRLLISAIKIAGQLERIADYTVNISDYILINEKDKIVDEKGKKFISVFDDNIVIIIDYIIEMISLGRKTILEENLEYIKEILILDKKIDNLYNSSLNELVRLSSIENATSDVLAKTNMNIILLFKYLERSGDHLVNIAETIFYIIKGRSYDHHYLLEDELTE